MTGERLTEGTPRGVGALIDSGGREAVNTVFGAQTTGVRNVQAENTFRYNLSPLDFDFLSSDGTDGFAGTSGNSGVADAKGFVETGTDTADAIVQDTNRVRYQAGFEAGMLCTLGFPATDPDATLRGGMFDSHDGFWVGHDGTDYVVGHRRAQSTTEIPRSEWDDPLDGSGPSGVTRDLSGLNIYRISFGYLGAAPVAYEMLLPREHGGWTEFHRLTFGGTDSDTNVINPVLPPRLQAYRPSTTGSNARIETGSWLGYTIAGNDGSIQALPFEREGIRDSVSTATNEHVLTIRVKDTFQGHRSEIPVQPRTLNIAASSGSYILAYAVRNATFGASLSYTDVDTDSSTVEYATDATTVTNGRQVSVVPLASGGRAKAESDTATISSERLNAGDTLSVYMTTPGNPNYYIAALGWSELF